jgi:putative transposase
MDAPISPRDHAEAVALFRAEIVGSLVRRELDRGDLAAELAQLSQRSFRPPRAHGHGPRRFSVATLERWFYAYRSGGLDALRPRPRTNKGRARELTDAQRDLLLAVRQEHPQISAALILRTLVKSGRLDEGAVSAATVRRLFAERGLDRVALRQAGDGKLRLRWQAERPNALWHADVCHGAPIVVDGARSPVRIHAILDDASRFVVAIEARPHECEGDMIAVLLRALRLYGAPDALYLDNGATYRGEGLRLGSERLGVTLLHAKPYDAPARGKMERFWRTLREGCLDFCGAATSLHDLNVRLFAWLDEHYHAAPHAGLLGDTPAVAFEAGAVERAPVDDARLRDALTVRARRRVRRDNTVSVDGVDWQTDLGFLATRLVTVARTLAEPNLPPWIEHEDRPYPLQPVDPVANARRTRPPLATTARPITDFDPPGVLLDHAVGRRHRRAP